MVQGVSFSNFGASFGKSVQPKQGNPPQEFLAKLKQAGIPENIISQGKGAVESYAQTNGISLPQPPAPPTGGKPDGVAGSKSQGAQHANNHSALSKVTSDDIKNVMEKNGIISTGNLKDDLSAIKTALKGLDADEKSLLRDKFTSLGVSIDVAEKTEAPKDAFKGLDQLGSLNKHFLIKDKKKAV